MGIYLAKRNLKPDDVRKEQRPNRWWIIEKDRVTGYEIMGGSWYGVEN